MITGVYMHIYNKTKANCDREVHGYYSSLRSVGIGMFLSFVGIRGW
jgi:hypothetical protein